MKKIVNLKNNKKLIVEITKNSPKEIIKGLVGWTFFISFLYYIMR